MSARVCCLCAVCFIGDVSHAVANQDDIAAAGGIARLIDILSAAPTARVLEAVAWALRFIVKGHGMLAATRARN